MQPESGHVGDHDDAMVLAETRCPFAGRGWIEIVKDCATREPVLGDLEVLADRLLRAIRDLSVDRRMALAGMTALGGHDPHGRVHYVEVL